MTRRALAGSVCALLLASCGGGAPPPASAPGGAREPGPTVTTDGESEHRKQQQQQPGYGQQPGYAEPGAAPAQPLGPGGPFAEAPPQTLDEALSALDQAASELSGAATDCQRACKALGSMLRSTERICELNGPDDPDERCQKARDRVDAARELLRRRACACE